MPVRAQSRPQVLAVPPEDIWFGAEQAREELVVPPAEPHTCQQFWGAGGRAPCQRSQLMAYSYGARDLKS